MRFQDRHEAGQLLARRLGAFADEDTVVLALPRGGVVVGYEVATALGLPLEVLGVRKLGVPWQPELAMGAIAEGGAIYLNRNVLQMNDVQPDEVREVSASEKRELERRVQRYREGRTLPQVRGRTVLLVDDGLATGSTARAAIQALRRLSPRVLVLATPVASAETAAELRSEVDAVVSVREPTNLWAIGAWYNDFRPVSDEEVSLLLDRAHQAQPATEPSAP
ncbi:phosphoribosyltransferase [Corallococcus sp. M34]|uniref:phosphoribosyltransferase n=1 Tax=Citreicoccus inhibens TaxID=2849499 RepID=UPI001C249CA6|nr:phosphoribosyltransferase [Citreicoccus inhibens]MBU8896750.1 phosphoribosyltransferase [Citreicoccus inhibens]